MYEIFGLDTRIFFLMWCTGFWLYLDQFEFLFYSRSFHSLFKRITENFLFLRYYKWLSRILCILYISWIKWLLTIRSIRTQFHEKQTAYLMLINWWYHIHSSYTTKPIRRRNLSRIHYWIVMNHPIFIRCNFAYKMFCSFIRRMHTTHRFHQ